MEQYTMYVNSSDPDRNGWVADYTFDQFDGSVCGFGTTLLMHRALRMNREVVDKVDRHIDSLGGIIAGKRIFEW